MISYHILIIYNWQVWFTLEDKSPWSQLRDVQSVETPCNELGNADLSEWP